MPISPEKKQVSSFFNKVRDNVVDRQRHYTEAAMKILFRESPHYMDTIDPAMIAFQDQGTEHGNVSNKAKGEYDANHKILINSGIASPHNSPTRSYTGSYMIHTLEAQKTKTIKSGDCVRIMNTTGHGKSVEYGNQLDQKWKKPGYYPYNTTKKHLHRLAQGIK